MIWNSLTHLLCAIASRVTVRDLRFEEMLNMLDPVLLRSDVRAAMEKCNADAVWLRLYKKSLQNGGEKTAAAGLVGRIPAGKPHWHFVQV
jgi:hypothetical protein